MSKNKSQIGRSSIARQQPPPLALGRQFSTTPPIAGTPAVIRRAPEPPAEAVSAAPPAPQPRIAPRSPHAAPATKHERRAQRDQLNSAARWVTENVEPAPAREAHSHARADESPKRAVQLAPNETRISPDQFRKLIGQLQVRIKALGELQEKRELVLADPTVHRDETRWRHLRAEFEAGQAKLEELIDRREYAEAQLDGLRESADRAPPPGPTTKRITQRLSASVIRARMGRRVRDLRMQRGMTQQDLAGLAEIPGYVLPSIENGDKGAPVDVLAAIAFALDVTLSELLLGVDAATPEAERLAGVLAAQPAESQRALALVELALTVASKVDS